MEELQTNSINKMNGVPEKLSNDTLLALEELGDVIKCIHKRMVSEGYEIVGGNIRKKILQNVYEKA